MIDDARPIVERLAADLGFHAVRFATLGPTPDHERYERWIAAGRHGDMEWMERHLDLRADPSLRLEGARSVAVLSMEHHHRRPPDPGGRTGKVARYAWGRDYHNLVGKALRKLRKRLRAEGIGNWGGVDTAPIIERAWARAAGLGFTGKNCLSIWPGRTSWMFLAVLFLDAPAAPDPPLGDHCGTCRRCLDACPTDAFLGPRRLDANRCISYWTIEADGLPPRSLRPAFGRWVFGCDVCQEVCPHNHGPPDPGVDDFRPRHAWLDLDEILADPDDDLMERFIGTPLRRPKAHGLKRNALIALGNLGDPGGLPAARLALEHPHPVVRAAAVWALGRLGERAVLDHDDPHPLVRAEVEGERRA